MKKILFSFGLLAFILLGSIRVMAQTTEPGANLPLLPDSSTSTTATTYTASATPYSSYSTQGTDVTYGTTATPVTTTQTAVDDAQTGSEVVFLAVLSVTGGIGLFLIKKYFDFKRYSL